MQATSVVDDYVIKAIQRAQFEHLEHDSCAALVPGFPGLIALGRDGRACLFDLWERIEDWVRASFEGGLKLPVIDGIDLHTERTRNLAAYHEHVGDRERGRFLECDEEFLETLAE